MKYALLVYVDEKLTASMTPEQGQELMGGYMRLDQELDAKKAKLAGDALQPVGSATSVRVRGSKTLTTDGPFAETKEQLGGFYLLECANLDEAIAWAAKIPNAKNGTIEVRPVWNYMEG